MFSAKGTKSEETGVSMFANYLDLLVYLHARDLRTVQLSRVTLTLTCTLLERYFVGLVRGHIMDLYTIYHSTILIIGYFTLYKSKFTPLRKETVFVHFHTVKSYALQMDR